MTNIKLGSSKAPITAGIPNRVKFDSFLSHLTTHPRFNKNNGVSIYINYTGDPCMRCIKNDGSGWTHEVSERYKISDVRVDGHICPPFSISLLQRLNAMGVRFVRWLGAPADARVQRAPLKWSWALLKKGGSGQWMNEWMNEWMVTNLGLGSRRARQQVPTKHLRVS